MAYVVDAAVVAVAVVAVDGDDVAVVVDVGVAVDGAGCAERQPASSATRRLNAPALCGEAQQHLTFLGHCCCLCRLCCCCWKL